MRRDELRVEQGKAAEAQARHEIGQADLRGVGGAVKHALAEKGASQRQAVKPAGQFAVAPGLDGVDEAHFEQFAEQGGDGVVDPGLFAPRPALGAACEHGVETGVDPDVEFLRSDRLGQAFRDHQALKRKNPALARVEPVQIFGLRVLGHRKQAGGIGAHQNVRRDRFRLGRRRAHGPFSLPPRRGTSHFHADNLSGRRATPWTRCICVPYPPAPRPIRRRKRHSSSGCRKWRSSRFRQKTRTAA